MGDCDQPIKSSEPRVLCLHGWRTSGSILKNQMAALRYNVKMNCVYIDAPFAAVGDPVSGISQFYPDQPYYEWVLKGESEDSTIETSLTYIMDYISKHGPFDGVLGFSQGAAMATRLAIRMQQARDDTLGVQPNPTIFSSIVSTISKRKTPKSEHLNSIKFFVLIGGVPPAEYCSTDSTSSSRINCDVCPLAIPSLHLQGSIDPYVEYSKVLAEMYLEAIRTVCVHGEGHNIPSIRTALYPDIHRWVTSCMS